MAIDRDRGFSRRLLITLAVLGVFVAADLALFGWLIFRSLSEKEVERALLETQKDAEELAGQLAESAAGGVDDLYTIVARERNTRTYIDSILRQQDVVMTVEIEDKNGALVFRRRVEDTIPSGGTPLDIQGLQPVEIGPDVEVQSSEDESSFETYDLTLPIGELGSLRIGISELELLRRVEVLRGELLRQAALIAVVSLLILALAYLVIWWLWRRGRQFEKAAIESERMAYLGTLASGLAHEIRNPLNSLNLNIQMLQEEIGPRALDSSGDRLLSITRSEIGRLERLVSDFLSYARPRPLQFELQRPAELLERCSEVLASQARLQQATVSVEDLAGDARIRVDFEQMLQLLLNVAQNALASTEGLDRPPKVGLIASLDDGRVALSVEDNGIGLAPEIREKMFDLFYSNRKGGTGLGLAIVQRIARAHGAEIEVSSIPGEGTRVRVVLPVAQQTRDGETRGGSGSTQPSTTAA